MPLAASVALPEAAVAVAAVAAALSVLSDGVGGNNSQVGPGYPQGNHPLPGLRWQFIYATRKGAP